MTKKEIIELLNKEVGLFIEHEDEDSLGELYLTSIQLKDAESVLSKLKLIYKSQEEWKNKLRKIVEGNDRFCILNKSEISFKDKIINIPFPLIIIDGRNFFGNNYFNAKSNDLRTS